jgi:dolichol-phosphate mannosyltransferase
VVVLTPVFNEQANLPRYEQTVRDVLLARGDVDFRFLFIDDGSADPSWQTVKDICARDPEHFRGIRLSRNYGSHVALSAGFANADHHADAIATLACDLQDPPEVVLEFVRCWRRERRPHRLGQASRPRRAGLARAHQRPFSPAAAPLRDAARLAVHDG